MGSLLYWLFDRPDMQVQTVSVRGEIISIDQLKSELPTAVPFTWLYNISCGDARLCEPGFKCTDGIRDQCETRTFNRLEGQNFCQYCSPGRFSNETGLRECYLCSPGQYQNEAGELQCKLSPSGEFVDTSDSSFTTPCPVGTYQDETGASYCKNCSDAGPLSYTNLPRLQLCLQCPAGESPLLNRTGCVASPCQPGSFDIINKLLSQFNFSESANLTSIMQQLDPQYSDFASNLVSLFPASSDIDDSTGLPLDLRCPLCPVGRYSSQGGQTICSACPDGEFTFSQGSTLCWRLGSGSGPDSDPVLSSNEADARSAVPSAGSSTGLRVSRGRLLALRDFFPTLELVRPGTSEASGRPLWACSDASVRSQLGLSSLNPPLYLHSRLFPASYCSLPAGLQGLYSPQFAAFPCPEGHCPGGGALSLSLFKE
jgi:hypothetical protein